MFTFLLLSLNRTKLVCRDKIIIPDTLRLEIPNLFQTGILSLNYISFIFVMHHIGIIQRLYNILVLNWNMIFPGVQSLQCPELCTVRNYDFISRSRAWPRIKNNSQSILDYPGILPYLVMNIRLLPDLITSASHVTLNIVTLSRPS